MSSFVHLTLDTTAPVVTFGSVSGTEAGQLIQVAYSVDEPDVDHATLLLPDARELAMLVQADRLEVLLPPDTPSGTATVTAFTRDDVDNTASFELEVEVTGIVSTVPQAPGRSPGLPTAPPPRPRRAAPPEPASPAPRTLRRRSRARVRTTTRLSTVATARSAARAGSHGLTLGAVRGAATATVTDRHAVRGSRTSNSEARLSETTAIHRRPEGPSAEDDLLLLDLL